MLTFEAKTLASIFTKMWKLGLMDQSLKGALQLRCYSCKDLVGNVLSEDLRLRPTRSRWLGFKTGLEYSALGSSFCKAKLQGGVIGILAKYLISGLEYISQFIPNNHKNVMEKAKMVHIIEKCWTYLALEYLIIGMDFKFYYFLFSYLFSWEI